jgi:periplasmic divalent cation tolerance protein
MKIITITTTTATAEAATELAQHVVLERLAACIQIDGPIQSIYYWQGQLSESVEYRLTCKTLAPYTERAVEVIKSRHPYEVPEILVSESLASQEYLDWVSSELRHSVGGQ